jgi:hypothetical protein
MIEIPVSPGELLDRITILEIKHAYITQTEKKHHIETELELLRRAAKKHIAKSPVLASLTRELKAVNEMLWQIEDAIRCCERNADFGDEFIGLARAVYRQNDRRSEVKRHINTLLDAEIVEEKSYESY